MTCRRVEQARQWCRLSPAMFCSQCHAEYRPGFTVCLDCDIALVHTLPEVVQKVSKASPSGSVEMLWEGEDLALFKRLLDELEAAGIRYFDQPLGIYPGVRRWDQFPVQPMSRFGYQVAVLSSDLVPAKLILERLLEDQPHDMELPAQDEKENGTPERTARKEGALICEIWSGSDESLAEFLEAALKEDGIPVRLERQGATAGIYTTSEDGGHAREIVKEVVDGVPPE